MEDNDTNYIDPQIERMKYKNILIILIIIFFIVIKICSHQIKFQDFLNFKPISISYKQIYDIKEYLIFFAIIIPISCFLWKSNIKWAKEQINLMEEKEEEKKRLKMIKRQEEFENKMRVVHFKDE